MEFGFNVAAGSGCRDGVRAIELEFTKPGADSAEAVHDPLEGRDDRVRRVNRSKALMSEPPAIVGAVDRDAEELRRCQDVDGESFLGDEGGKGRCHEGALIVRVNRLGGRIRGTLRRPQERQRVLLGWPVLGVNGCGVACSDGVHPRPKRILRSIRSIGGNMPSVKIPLASSRTISH